MCHKYGINKILQFHALSCRYEVYGRRQAGAQQFPLISGDRADLKRLQPGGRRLPEGRPARDQKHLQKLPHPVPKTEARHPKLTSAFRT